MVISIVYQIKLVIKSAVKLNAVCKNTDLIDVWSEKHGTMTGYTWCDGENVPKSRIDYMFLSKDFIYDVKQIIVRKIPGTHSNGSRMSDHRALKCTFYLSHNEKGSGYWKLNTSYLDNIEYINGVKDIIQNVKESIDDSHLSKWETLKYNVKTFSLQFAKNFQKCIKQKICTLEKEITDIEDSPSDTIDMVKKKELEKQLSELCNDKFKGAQIRSRAKWIEQGEKNSNYFLSLEAKHQSSNVIRELIDSQRSIIRSDNEILGEMCNFYKNFYTTRDIANTDIDSYLSSLENLTCLSNEDKSFCDTFPTLVYQMSFTKHFGKIWTIYFMMH